MNDKLKAAHDKLQAAVEEIVSGDDWRRMLKVASKFHNYSFNNQLLIFLQRPDATHVAGFHRWRSLGRCVKKGEKGIAIFAPCKYRQKDESSRESNSPTSTSDLGSSSDSDLKATHVIKGFRVVHVFDISQTEGKPLDDLEAVKPKLLDGAAPEGIWDALVAHAKYAGFEVVRDRKGSENGYCDFLAKKIGVRPDVSEAQALKTLVHELGHALLHTDNPPKTAATAEVEVESTAFIVLEALGMDSSEYSFAYVTRWAQGDLELVKETADRSVSCAHRILKGLDSGSPPPEVGARAHSEG